MAIISKNIENLKPDQEYIVSVRSINSDVNITSDYSDSIRFKTPTDSTIPSAPTNLEIVASFLNVLFKYTDAQDNDIFRYEYELYQDSQVELVNSVYRPKSGETPHRSGYVQTNIFLVSIDNNSYTITPGMVTNPIKYYGRVRSIDTSNNIGEWTQLAQSGNTLLIDEQYIGSLTAAKITAGEIGAHVISLSGGTGPGTYSMIKSSTYDSSAATPTGWYIRGDGHLNFGGPQGITYNGSTVVIGSNVNIQAELNANSITVGKNSTFLRIDDDLQSGTKAGMELGDPTFNYWYSDGTFRVGNGSTYADWNGSSLTIQGTIQAGTIGGVTISPTKLYIGTGTFNNSNTSFYVDNSGQFSLKDKLVWNGTSLTIAGDVTIGSSSGSTIAAGAASGATAVQPGQVNSNVTSISGGVITTGTINLNNVNVQTGSSGARLQIDSTGIKAYDSGGTNTVSIGSDGTASFSGTITSTSGTIGGWSILSTELKSGTFYLNSSGDAFLRNIVASSIGGFGSGVSTGTGSLTSMFLRNIQYGGGRPTGGNIGDIYLS